MLFRRRNEKRTPLVITSKFLAEAGGCVQTTRSWNWKMAAWASWLSWMGDRKYRDALVLRKPWVFAYISWGRELCQSKLTNCQLVLARQCLRKLSHSNKQGPTKLTIKVGRNRISGERSAAAKCRACIHLLQAQRESGTKCRILSRRNRPAVGRAEAGHPIWSTLSLWKAPWERNKTHLSGVFGPAPVFIP